MTRDLHSPISITPEPPTPSNTAGRPSTLPPFLPLHTAVVLLMASFFGVVMGGLTFLSERSVPKAVAVGLTTAGLSISVLRRLIG